jgi:hypothetical protein
MNPYILALLYSLLTTFLAYWAIFFLNKLIDAATVVRIGDFKSFFLRNWGWIALAHLFLQVVWDFEAWGLLAIALIFLLVSTAGAGKPGYCREL